MIKTLTSESHTELHPARFSKLGSVLFIFAKYIFVKCDPHHHEDAKADMTKLLQHHSTVNKNRVQSEKLIHFLAFFSFLLSNAVNKQAPSVLNFGQ